jgi:hypothetical protein
MAAEEQEQTSKGDGNGSRFHVATFDLMRCSNLRFSLSRMFLATAVFALVLGLGRLSQADMTWTVGAATGACGLTLLTVRRNAKELLSGTVCTICGVAVALFFAGFRDPPSPELGVPGAIVGWLDGFSDALYCLVFADDHTISSPMAKSSR